MSAIPTRLLIHSCTLKHQTGLDRSRNPTYSETLLGNVRIGGEFRTTRGNIGETKADTLTMFIDAKNTTYATAEGEEAETVIPVENDSVEWNGKSYTVRSVTPCYALDGETPHHWEVTLE